MRMMRESDDITSALRLPGEDKKCEQSGTAARRTEMIPVAKKFLAFQAVPQPPMGYACR